MERDEIVNKLKHIGRLARDRSNNLSVRSPYDTWVSNFFPQHPTIPTEPQQRTYQQYPRAVQPKLPSKAPQIVFFSIAALFCFSFIICLGFWLISTLTPPDILLSDGLADTKLWRDMSITEFSFFLLFLILGIVFASRRSNAKNYPPPGPYRDYLECCKGIQKYNKEAERWNRNELPKARANYKAQIKRYNSDCIEWEHTCTSIREEKHPEYDAWIAGLDEELDRINKELSEFSGFLHEEYWPNADELADLIEKGRADSVKEAINLFVQEENEQRRHNALMWAQRESAEENARRAEEWHKEEVEAAERRYNDMLATQQKIADAQEAAAAAQRGSVYCANCASANICGTVGHGTANCFIPRK